MVTVKLTVVLAFVVLGAFYVRSANWHPFIPPNTGEFGSFGLSGLTGDADPIAGALAGLAKTARHEWPTADCRALDFAPADDHRVEACRRAVPGHAVRDHAVVLDPVAKGVRVIGHEWFSLFIELGALIGLTTVIPSCSTARADSRRWRTTASCRPVRARPSDAQDALPRAAAARPRRRRRRWLGADRYPRRTR
jgi:hypothetical protein